MKVIKNLIGAVLIAIAVFLFWVLILPDYYEEAYLKSAAESRLIDFETKRDVISKVEKLDKEYQSRYAELKRLSMVIPTEKNIEEMITMFEKIFSVAGVPLTGMSLAADEEKPGQTHSSINVDFSFNTSYDSAINFLGILEKSLRLIDVGNLSIITEKDELADKDESPVLKVSFRARSYFLNKIIKAQSNIQQPVIIEE